MTFLMQSSRTDLVSLSVIHTAQKFYNEITKSHLELDVFYQPTIQFREILIAMI